MFTRSADGVSGHCWTFSSNKITFEGRRVSASVNHRGILDINVVFIKVTSNSTHASVILDYMYTCGTAV